jgi:hypothetical protein
VATNATNCLEKAEVEGKSKVTTRVCHDPPVTEIAPVQSAVQVVTEARAKPFEQWDTNEVCRLVQSIDGVGFAEVANAIKANGINGKCFSKMLRDNDELLTTSIDDDGLGFKKLQLKAVESKIDEIEAGRTSAEKSANNKATSQQPQINERQKVL